MFNRLTLINILLLIILFFLLKQTSQLWFHNPTAIHSIKPKKTSKRDGQISLGKKAIPPKSSFDIISDKNLFHPERKWGEGVSKEGPKKNVLPNITSNKEVILYGVMIFGNQRIALLGEGSPSAKRSKEKKKVSIGDTFAGYQVVEIYPDKITLQREGQLKTLDLYKPKKDRRISLPQPTTRSRVRPPARLPGRSRAKRSPRKSLPEIFRGARGKD
jgi:hypothetical protein